VIESRYVPDSFARKFVGYLFGIIICHYFLWPFAMIGFLVALWRMGFWWLSLIFLIAYLPGFFNNDQLKLGRPWHAFRKHKIWHLIQSHLNVELVREQALDASKKYIFGVYPHGILILSRPAIYGGAFESLFPGVDIRTLGATPMFWVPGSRELCLWMGAVDAAKKTAMRVLTKFSLMIYPGGSAEIFLTDPESKITTLVARKGFIKLAIQSGVDIVPAFVFGEKWLYHRAHLPRFVQNFFMKTLRLPLIIFWGQWFTWLPLRRHLSVVFGTPIHVKQIDEPTVEQINAVYNTYITAIQDIFERYKKTYGYSEDESLVIKDDGKAS
jgi:hypothetical protein